MPRRAWVSAWHDDAVITDARARFIGGASVPALWGRVNGTWPLAMLEIGSRSISVRLLKVARVLAGAESLEATRATLQRAYPIRGLWSPGVGFTDHNDHDFYFWTLSGPRILEVLARLHYPVTMEREAAAKAWSREP